MLEGTRSDTLWEDIFRATYFGQDISESVTYRLLMFLEFFIG